MPNLADTLSITPEGERDIIIRRSFAAPRHLLFAAWTDPAILPQWMGPRSCPMISCSVDLRPGGTYRLVFSSPQGEMGMSGIYHEIDPPNRLTVTERFEQYPDAPSEITTVFTEAAGLTTVTSTITCFSAEVRSAILASGMQRGVAEGYTRLDEYLAEHAETAQPAGAAQ